MSRCWLLLCQHFCGQRVPRTMPNNASSSTWQPCVCYQPVPSKLFCDILMTFYEHEVNITSKYPFSLSDQNFFILIIGNLTMSLLHIVRWVNDRLRNRLLARVSYVLDRIPGLGCCLSVVSVERKCSIYQLFCYFIHLHYRKNKILCTLKVENLLRKQILYLIGRDLLFRLD